MYYFGIENFSVVCEIDVVNLSFLKQEEITDDFLLKVKLLDKRNLQFINSKT